MHNKLKGFSAEVCYSAF